MVVTNEAGVLLDLLAPSNAGDDVHYLSGILIPGLINAHCHLELSHFKGVVKEVTGLPDFLLAVVARRKVPQDSAFVQEKIAAAIAEMSANGIVGVGDICNTTDAIAAKKTSTLHWRNLIEVLNFSDDTLAQRLEHNNKVLQAHLSEGLAHSGFTAHAPYSVSSATFEAINKATKGGVVSVHNQETEAEDELFREGTGALLQLYDLTGTPAPIPSGQSSLKTWLPIFTQGQTVLLVHNTFTQKEDIRFAQAHADKHNLKLVWCLCPGANKYIENKLPPLAMLLEEGCVIALGTDSNSSNWQLSIAAEVKWLTDAFPQIPIEVLLEAATRNGAEALGWNHLGKLEKNLKPGLSLLHTDNDGNITGTSERVI